MSLTREDRKLSVEYVTRGVKDIMRTVMRNRGSLVFLVMSFLTLKVLGYRVLGVAT